MFQRPAAVLDFVVAGDQLDLAFGTVGTTEN